MAQQAIAILSSLITTIESGPSLYNFKALDIDDQEVSMSKYNGKLLLIVNVASQ